MRIGRCQTDTTKGYFDSVRRGGYYKPPSSTELHPLSSYRFVPGGRRSSGSEISGYKFTQPR
jgi:hypothetical protein